MKYGQSRSSLKIIELDTLKKYLMMMPDAVYLRPIIAACHSKKNTIFKAGNLHGGKIPVQKIFLVVSSGV